MSEFDSARVQLLLRDIERSTRRHMAGLQFEGIASPAPVLRLGDRLAVVRLSARLASAALVVRGCLHIGPFGQVGEEPDRSVIEVVLTDAPSPTRLAVAVSPNPPLPIPFAALGRAFASGVVVASLFWAGAWLLGLLSN